MSDLIKKLEDNWEQYVETVKKIKDPKKKEALLTLSDELKDRLAAVPASTQTKYVGAYPGGLVEHSLNVAKYTWLVSKNLNLNADFDSILLTGLFHDLGKVGTEKEDFYLEKKSDWHNERGIMFEINENLTNVSVQERTLWWLNKYSCPLSQDEISAILSLSNVGQVTLASNFYNTTPLTICLQTAVRAACLQATGKTSVLK